MSLKWTRSIFKFPKFPEETLVLVFSRPEDSLKHLNVDAL